MSGRETVEALVATLNARNVPGMDDLFHEDAVMEWPQSGERIVGGDNRRGVYTAFPQLPTITPRRIVGEGDCGSWRRPRLRGRRRVQGGLHLRDAGREDRTETAYWAEPFPAPDWRAAWVEHMEA